MDRIIAYDLDGTLYDSLDVMVTVIKSVFSDFGYTPPTKEAYRKFFQPHNWKQFYRDLGAKEKDVDGMIAAYVARFDSTEQPHLIKGARRALEKSEEAVGSKNIFFITNAPGALVKARLERDGLVHLIPNIRSPFEGKTNELHEIAKNCKSLDYVGDVVWDGVDVLNVRTRGETNIRFFAIAHEYAFNTLESLREFVDKHPEFANMLNGLDEIDRIWTPWS
ncbi:MAG: HAD hydrolase-like protein [Candidatus Aenigmatarchaeota archaeon]